jgi:hypothetical protein
MTEQDHELALFCSFGEVLLPILEPDLFASSLMPLAH